MLLELSDQERELLGELLGTKLKALIHEINHTDTREYKELLKENYDLVEELKAKIEDMPRMSPAVR